MSELPISQLPMLEEQEATGEVAQVFDDIKREANIPFIPHFFRTLAASPPALAGTWDAQLKIYMQTTLPMSLKTMILFSIAAARQCKYCSALHEVTCRTLGIDEETLGALVKDLDTLAPRRVQEIIKFALKCAEKPSSLTEADYDHVREQGVSDEELTEIIALAAFGVYLVILAGGLKVEVDSVFKQALEG